MSYQPSRETAQALLAASLASYVERNAAKLKNQIAAANTAPAPNPSRFRRVALPPVETMRGTPTAVIRTMTAAEIRARLTQIETRFPRGYKATSLLDKRFHDTARAEMVRLRRELNTR